jgi:xanthine dehydrogenase large subunit
MSATRSARSRRTTYEQAVKAARAVALDIEELEPVLDVETAHAKGSYVMPPQILIEGDVDAALAASARVIEGRLDIGGQDHFYLETHIGYAIPGEDGDMIVHSSTQHPTEVQHHVAHVLGGLANSVDVFTRRMGGGFGGKESQATIIAASPPHCWPAKDRQASGARLRLKRSVDMSGDRQASRHGRDMEGRRR